MLSRKRVINTPLRLTFLFETWLNQMNALKFALQTSLGTKCGAFFHQRIQSVAFEKVFLDKTQNIRIFLWEIGMEKVAQGSQTLLVPSQCCSNPSGVKVSDSSILENVVISRIFIPPHPGSSTPI